MSTKGRWIRALVCTVVVLVTLPWAPLSGRPARAGATASQDKVFVAPVTGSYNAGNPEEHGAAGDSEETGNAVVMQLGAKYPCARITSASLNGKLMALSKQQQLAGGEGLPRAMENIAAGMDATLVFVSYSVRDDLYSVTVQVVDPTTSQYVDTQIVTGTGKNGSVLTDLAEAAVNKLNVGLCQTYWAGSITIEEDADLTSKPSGKGAGANSATSHFHTLESVRLVPPSTRSKSTGDVNQPMAIIDYTETTTADTSGIMAFNDDCKGLVVEKTDRTVEHLKEDGTNKDTWNDNVGIVLNRDSGTYSIAVPGALNIVEKRLEYTIEKDEYSAPLCTPREPTAPRPPGTEKGDVLPRTLTGKLDPKHPYVLKSPPSPPPLVTPDGTFKREVTWSLELKNPPSSGTP